MKHSSNVKIVFMGTPEFGAIILEKLVENQYKPLLVVTTLDKPLGRKQILTPSPVKITAQKYNLPLFQRRLNNSSGVYLLIQKLKEIKPDLIVVAAYNVILPKEILDIPKYNCLNVHPSLLPRWRGPSPIQYTILNGDKKTGLTIIKMTEKVDAGPIVAQKELSSFTGKENYKTLYWQLANLGGDLLVETIPYWIEGKIKPKPQDDSLATYTKILKTTDGLIDWKKPVDYIERQIRALNPEPGAYTFYKEKILKILEAKVINNKLVIEKVQLEGKRPMSFQDFLLGHPDFVNSKFSDKMLK